MVMKTKQQLKAQREYRKRTHNVGTIKYEKTRNGFLMRKYRNMQSRVCGVQKLKYHLYHDLEILPREDFYEWSKKSPDFENLFTSWEKSNYERKLCPSVDRVDPKKGYILTNMEWVTNSENSSRGARNRNVSK